MSHLAGPLDMSHIATGCVLGYLDLRHDARGWRKGRPALDAWYARIFAARQHDAHRAGLRFRNGWADCSRAPDPPPSTCVKKRDTSAL